MMKATEVVNDPEPKSPRVMFRVSSDSSVQSLSSDRPSSFLMAIREGYSIDTIENQGQVWKFGFYIKILQLVITIACIGCYTSGRHMADYSINAVVFPFVTFFSYLLINSIIILSYVMRQKMPEILIRMFGILGGILYMVVSAVTLESYVLYSSQKSLAYLRNYSIDSKRCILTTSILAMINAILYYADTCISYYKSLNGLFT